MIPTVWYIGFMAGQMISFQCGGVDYDGYLSKQVEGPGVIVLQEWWGLVGHIKDVANRLAAEGFVVLAPDLYEGESTVEPEEAGTLMMALNIDKTERLLKCAVDRLLEDPSTIRDKVGVVGFCMGGQLSLFAAATNAQIGACVDFYGIHPNVKPPFEDMQAPVLGFFAEHDAYASPEAVSGISAQLTAAGKRHEFKTYPGTQHAFFNSDRPEVHDKEASEDSWQRMLAFLRSELH